MPSPLQEGTWLKRLLPLLWPLADPATPASRAAAAYPTSLLQELLAALAAYPLPAPVEEERQEGAGAGEARLHLGDQRALLVAALREAWA